MNRRIILPGLLTLVGFLLTYAVWAVSPPGIEYHH
jgi:hypothetical protein